MLFCIIGNCFTSMCKHLGGLQPTRVISNSFIVNKIPSCSMSQLQREYSACKAESE